MSREIKFRAWDKKQKKMLYGVTIGTVKVWDENAPLFSHEFSYSEDCVFEQYTGLNDKSGKEIYEGDIVSLYDRFVSAIIWQDNYCGFRWYNKLDGYCQLCKDSEEYYEVIGNIHENPELLGDEE